MEEIRTKRDIQNAKRRAKSVSETKEERKERLTLRNEKDRARRARKREAERGLPDGQQNEPGK